ncbi:MAG: hypothetical protein V4864_00140 [Pseudomonadota bacterium]
MKSTRQPKAPGHDMAETASEAEVIEDARPQALAQRKLQDAAAQSPQARRMAQLREMVDGSPVQLRQGGVVQRLEAEDARKRLGAEVGEQKNTVAVLIALHAVRDEIPKIEAALSKYPDFLKQYPVRPRSGFVSTRKQMRGILQLPVKALLGDLPTFLDVLESLEDWYMEADPEEREEQARKNLAHWQHMVLTFTGADAPITALLDSRPASDDLIDAGMVRIQRLRQEITMWFSTAGGFSAMGRAHDITTDIQPQKNENESLQERKEAEKDEPGAATDGMENDDSFVRGYSQGPGGKAARVSDRINVHKKKRLIVQEGPLFVGAARIIDADVSDATLPREERRKSVEGGMKRLGAGGDWEKRFTTLPAPRDRGDGQYTNMNKTNARGYAWLHDMPGWKTTAWEWLHVRAASLGGATDGSNLVLGTRDANTLMMPFESNIRMLSGLVKSYPATLDTLAVRWTTEDSEMHAPKTIKITWDLLPKEGAPEKVATLAGKASGEVVVSNLHTHSNLSKVEVQWIEGQLSGFRKSLEGDEQG